MDGLPVSNNSSWLFTAPEGACGSKNVLLNVTDASKADASASWNVTVRLRGDVINVTGLNVIDVFDISAVGLSFGSAPGDPKWNRNADIYPFPGINGEPEGDGVIDIFDLSTVGLNFGRECQLPE
jgi:hypothetical protein